ncbi:unnamed protein product [Oikopleura dioica]|uniref:Uncharacterized protein n=1 Tax=Oikopleura dioica TaxID=34765 RepID=E4XZY8_OIKDI|nr:unnamed protein product [Oikopleura dioica]
MSSKTTRAVLSSHPATPNNMFTSFWPPQSAQLSKNLPKFTTLPWEIYNFILARLSRLQHFSLQKTTATTTAIDFLTPRCSVTIHSM